MGTGNNYSSGNTVDVENQTIQEIFYYPTAGVPNIIGPNQLNNRPGEGLCALTCSELEDIRDNLDDGATLSTDLINKDELGIYPNPTTGFFSIKNLKGVNLSKPTLSLYNHLGMEVKTISVSDGIGNIDVSLLSNGLYLVELKTTEGTYTNKLIIQH
jgi:hypothetical protein